ncbi:hypothetical protein H6769_00780 [Candidatus Peribacteria bacterium]|nr:hypothetical protein [Candidatus Peribacteria bacterium]
MNADRSISDLSMIGQISLIPSDKERIKPGITSIDPIALESLQSIMNYLTIHE